MRQAAQRGARRQRGIAAVELALVLPVLFILVMFPLYLGRVYWHYTAIQYAAQDAARYLSKVPVSEFQTPRIAAMTAVASAIAAQDLAELAPGYSPYMIALECGGGPCTGASTRPASVQVKIRVAMEDIFFSGRTGMDMTLTAEVTYPYVGR